MRPIQTFQAPFPCIGFHSSQCILHIPLLGQHGYVSHTFAYHSFIFRIHRSCNIWRGLVDSFLAASIYNRRSLNLILKRYPSAPAVASFAFKRLFSPPVCCYQILSSYLFYRLPFIHRTYVRQASIIPLARNGLFTLYVTRRLFFKPSSHCFKWFLYDMNSIYDKNRCYLWHDSGSI